MSATPGIVFKGIDVGANSAADGLFKVRETRYGRMKYLATDYGVGQMLTLYGEYSEAEVALLRKILKPGNTVISAGGNIGCHLIPLSRIVAPGRVITFEPQEFIREKILRENLAVNQCDNVDVYPQALGAAIGTAHLPKIEYSIPNNFGGMELKEAGSGYVGVEVPVVTVDSLALPALEMLMLDIEGFELNALMGARDTIMRHRPYLYIETDRDEANREAILRYMKDELDYELLFHLAYCFNPKNFDGNPKNSFGMMGSIMTLGVPR